MKTQPPTHNMLPRQQQQLRVPQSPSDLLCVSPTSKFLNGVPGSKRTRSQVLKDLALANADGSAAKRVCHKSPPPAAPREPKKPALTPRSVNTHHHHHAHKKLKKNAVHPSLIAPTTTTAPKRAPSPVV